MNIDIRECIINNFKEDSLEDVRISIDKAIKAKEEDSLIGLGVFFELLWNNSDENVKQLIVNNIKKSLPEK